MTTGPVVRLEGELDRGIHVLFLLDADREASVRLGELDEVGDADGAVPGVEARVRVAAVVEQRLPLAHHAERRVVDDRDLDRDVVDRAGGELLIGHLEAAVAVDRPHVAVGLGDLRAHRRRHRVAHRAGAAGVEPRVRALVLDELRRPHLVLTDAGGVDALGAGELADALDHVLRRHEAVGRLRVAERELVAEAVEERPPLRDVGLRALRRRCGRRPRGRRGRP